MGLFSYKICTIETANLVFMLLDDDLIEAIIEQERTFSDSMLSL